MKFESRISNFTFDEGKFAKCKVDVAHDKLNHNNSWFDADRLLACAEKSLRCSPILANVFKNEDGKYEVGGHDMKINFLETKDGIEADIFFEEHAVGFIPHDAPMEIVYNPEDKRNHLHTYGVIWKNYSSQLLDYMEKNNNELSVSMEIEVLDSITANDGSEIIKDFVFNGITILGKDVPPAMENAKIQKVFSMEDIKSELKEMMKMYAIEMEGGENMDKDKVVESEVKEEVFEEVAEDEFACDPKKKRNCEEEDMACDPKKKRNCEEDEDDKKKKDEEDMACKKKKYEELEEKYSALEKSYAELEAKLESMADYAELKAFKDAYDAEQYKAKVDAISKEFGLAEKDFKDIREKAYAKEISLENYEEKLALISYRQNAKKNFGAEKEKNEAMIIDSTDTEEISIYGELDKYFK